MRHSLLVIFAVLSFSCVARLSAPTAPARPPPGELVGPPQPEIRAPSPLKSSPCDELKTAMARVSPECNLEVLRGGPGPFCTALDALRAEFADLKCE